MSVPVDIHPGRDGKPPGPSPLLDALRGKVALRNGAEGLLAATREHGDLIFYRILGRPTYAIAHPDLVSDFLLKDSIYHHRNLVMQKARDVLGNGLLTSEEPVHMRQRRLAQPAFLRDRIAGYGTVIGHKTLSMTSRWTPTQTPAETVDLYPEMLELALRIVAKCLFDLDELDDVDAVASAVSSFMAFIPLSFLPFANIIERSPLPAMRRLRAGKAFLDQLIYGMIAQRRAEPGDRGDLLSMLLAATDEGSVMTDVQLRDECVTIILAGHETTANALSFSLHLLGCHPELQDRLAAEARAVLSSRAPTAADYARLPFATAVFAETMRLYPPVWVTARTCAQEYQIAGYTIPVGASILAPQYAIHRDPRFWSEPDRFDPDRFLGGGSPGRPRYAYYPFAGGSRQCIAEGLAWMEGTLALAAIFRDWRITVPNPSKKIKVHPAVSLRPAEGIKVRLERRQPEA